ILHDHKDAKERRRALVAMEVLGEKSPRKVVSALSKALREDKDESIREGAALKLGRTIRRAFAKARADKVEDLPRFDPGRDALSAAMRTDKVPRVREACAKALGEIGRDARAAVGALSLALKDKHPGTQAAAANALRLM